jgi:tight adherence protein B
MTKRNVLEMWLAMAGITLALILAWLFLPGLGIYIERHPAIFPAAILGASSLMVCLACVLWLESAHLRSSWLRRTATSAGLEALKPEPLLKRFSSKLAQAIDWIWQPLWKTKPGASMREAWLATGLPWRASLYPSVLIFFIVVSYFMGLRIAGPLLGSAFAFAAGMSVIRLVGARAASMSREIDEQLPAAIDSLAAGIAAGQSFQQALHATADEQSGPLGLVLKKLSTRLKLGLSTDEALMRLVEEHSQEGLGLVVEGILLQRQFGGDLVNMLDDVAALLRSRLELEREVRAITAQGRLSGAIVAGLVPVSAGFLLIFNPGYMDILFDTLIGQVLIVLTFTFQLAGWYVISRLVRVRY